MTVIADGDPEAALGRWWRPIAAAWPGLHGPPEAGVVPLARATELAGEMLGSAVLAVIEDHHSQAWLYRLVDHLWAERLGGVLTFAAIDKTRARLGGRGLLVARQDADPAVMGGMLHALIERQTVVESLHGDLRTARRFQGGLRGEMDKLHEELQLAAAVQGEFLPRSLPSMPNVDLQVLFRPCGYVSGDIYDVQRVGQHHLGFFIADAVGHGVPAALMTMVLCRSLQTTTAGPTPEPLPASEVIGRLNRAMVSGSGGDAQRFASAVYGLIDCRTRVVSVASAGHPPPLLIRGGVAERMDCSGALLGLFADEEFTEATVTLDDDTMLVAYSDGFETAFPHPDADEYGRRLPTRHFVERFVEMAGAWAAGGLSGALAGLARSLDEQAGSLHQVDDLTAISVVPSDANDLDELFRGGDARMAGDIPGSAREPLHRG